jgi:uncharacterized protein YxjI
LKAPIRARFGGLGRLTMLDRHTYFIRERVGMLKITDTYDIFDVETQEQIGIAQEKPSSLVIVLRFLISKKLLPTTVKIYAGYNPDDESKLVFSIRRGVGFFRTKVEVVDKDGTVMGWFLSKVFSLGGGFFVYDASGTQLAEVKGNWVGWDFKFLDLSGKEIGSISKKWAGLGKELFTSADNYVIQLSEDVSAGKSLLLLAAGLAIDTVLKENN